MGHLVEYLAQHLNCIRTVETISGGSRCRSNVGPLIHQLERRRWIIGTKSSNVVPGMTKLIVLPSGLHAYVGQTTFQKSIKVLCCPATVLSHQISNHVTLGTKTILSLNILSHDSNRPVPVVRKVQLHIEIFLAKLGKLLVDHLLIDSVTHLHIHKLILCHLCILTPQCKGQLLLQRSKEDKYNVVKTAHDRIHQNREIHVHLPIVGRLGVLKDVMRLSMCLVVVSTSVGIFQAQICQRGSTNGLRVDLVGKPAVEPVDL